MTNTGQIIGFSIAGAALLGLAGYTINKGVKKQRNRQEYDNENENALDNRGGTRRNRCNRNKSRRR